MLGHDSGVRQVDITVKSYELQGISNQQSVQALRE